MAIADELIALLGFELTGEDAAKRYEGTLKRLERTAERVGNAIGTGIRIGTAVAAAGFAFLSKSVIDVNAEFESYQATLETIEGSAEKARASLDWISEFAKTTPYDVAQVTAAFIKLKAYGIDPIADDTLRTLGDTASAMGKDLNQAVEALADAQTGEFERLKEFGIRAKQQGDEVTFSWTRNGEELTQTVKKSATEIRQFLLETMGDSFTGAMDRQSTTWNGMMSNLGDTWTGFQRKIGESGLFEKLSGQLAGFLDYLEVLDQNGTLDKWAAAIGGTMSWVADMLGAIFGRIAEDINFLIENFDTLKPILFAVGLALGALLVWAFPVVAIFIGLGLAVDDLISYLSGGESVIGDFINWCSQLPEVLGQAAEAFKTWLANIDWGQLGKDAGALLVDALVMAIVGYVQGTQAIARWMVDAFAAIDWGSIWGGAVAAWGAYVDVFYGFWEGVGTRILEILKEAFNIDLVAIGTKMGADLLAGLQSIGAQISAWFTGLFVAPQWVTDLQNGVSGFFQPPPGPGESEGAKAGELFGSMAPTPPAPNPAPAPANDNSWQRMMQNYAGNSNTQEGAEAAVVNQTDSRVISQTNNVTVNQTVTQPSAAPAAAANATGAAVQGAVANQRTQIETEPSF